MFRFRKLFNSASVVPETMVIDSFGCEIFEGALFVLSSGEPIGPYNDCRPEYAALKNCNYNDSKLPCFKITNNMVFEVEFIGDPSLLHVGSKLMIVSGTNGYSTAVQLCEEGDEYSSILEIYSTQGARKSGDRVLINFI